MSTEKRPRLLDEVWQVMRLHHYSIHTERTYCAWIRKFVRFHGLMSREDLAGEEEKFGRFLSQLG